MQKPNLIYKIGVFAFLSVMLISVMPSIDLADAGLPAKATSHMTAVKAVKLNQMKPATDEAVPLNVSLHQFNKIYKENQSEPVQNVELVSDPIISPSAKTFDIHNQEGKKSNLGTHNQKTSKVNTVPAGGKKKNATYREQSSAKTSQQTSKANKNNRKTSVTAKKQTANPDSKKTDQKAKAKKSTAVPSTSNVIGIAESLIGTPYKWGGTTPSGFDCSGFVQYVYAKAGIHLSRTANKMWNLNGSRVHSPQPGDLIFFTHTYSTNDAATHVGIYIGGGRFIHADSKSVTISSLSGEGGYWQSHYLGVKSVN